MTTIDRAPHVLTNFFLRVLRRRRLASDAKRRAIIRELIQTEKNYVDSLLICEEVYYKPLDRTIASKNPLIDPATLNELFGNLDEIRAAHQIIVREMDEVLPRLKRPFPPRGFYLRVVAPFGDLVPRMVQLYTQYLRTNGQSEAILQRLRKNKKFRSLMCECLFNPRSKCQEIEDLLILPTQRVAGYKMLFERVLRYFPVETFAPILAAYKDTLDALLDLGKSMNQEKADTGSQEKLLTIAETLTKIPPVMCLLKPGRRYLGEASLQLTDDAGKPTAQHVVYITSDILIIAKAVGSKLLWVEAIPIIQVRFAPSKVLELVETAFILESDTEHYNYLVNTPEKRDEFIGVVKTQKKEIKQQVAKQTHDGNEYIQGLLAEITRWYEAPLPRNSREEALDSVM